MKKLAMVPILILIASLPGCSSFDFRSVDEETMNELRHNRSVEMTPEIEEDLGKWIPDHTNLTGLISSISRPGMTVIGEWTTLMFEEGSTLKIDQAQKESYSVAFSSGGCLGDWDLRRTGTYSNGILRLNKPVQEYCPFTYDTLYAVSVGDCDYLISQAGIRFIEENYATNGVVDWVEHIQYSAFHRKIKEDTQPLGASDGINVVKQMCQLHKCTLEKRSIGSEARESYPKYSQARKMLFPNTGEPLGAGCLDPPGQSNITYVCAECCRARRTWLLREWVTRNILLRRIYASIYTLPSGVVCEDVYNLNQKVMSTITSSNYKTSIYYKNNKPAGITIWNSNQQIMAQGEFRKGSPWDGTFPAGESNGEMRVVRYKNGCQCQGLEGVK